MYTLKHHFCFADFRLSGGGEFVLESNNCGSLGYYRIAMYCKKMRDFFLYRFAQFNLNTLTRKKREKTNKLGSLKEVLSMEWLWEFT